MQFFNKFYVKMLRRGARERRELVYRRALDQKKRETEEKREREKPKSVAEPKTKNKSKEAPTLPSDIDDEYRWAGCEDPMVCITTSHNPSAKLKKFAKVCLYIFFHYLIYFLILLLGSCFNDSQCKTR